MKITRAATATIIGLTLTASGALAVAAHSSEAANGTAIRALAQQQASVGGLNANHGGAVSTLAESLSGQGAATTTTTTTTGAQGVHGAAVSAVAQDATAVGGPNTNHGGAVSLVARGAHGPSATHGQSTGKSQAGTHPTGH
ncbi:MAG: hypothetical protein QOE66_199 [Chloroflexota bacterium]|nr:hypothetical protein [Chloroflexota bacterium]